MFIFHLLDISVLYYLLLSVLKAIVSGERINLLPVIPTWMVADCANCGQPFRSFLLLSLNIMMSSYLDKEIEVQRH